MNAASFHESGAGIYCIDTDYTDPQRYSRSVEALAERNPSHCYITHFGALAFESAQVDALRRQLERYAQLGRQHPGDLPVLEANVSEIIEQELHRLEPSTARQRAAELTMDARLNARGIAHWSERLAA